MPTPLARDQALAILARSAIEPEPPRVWCWDQVWTATAANHPDPPARLSPAGVRAALGEAIERARRSGSLDRLAEAVDYPGARRRLLGQFAGWTRDERRPDRAPPGDSPAETEAWSLFGHYRATLADLGAEDDAGWSVWASRALIQTPPPELRRPGHVVALDPTDSSRAVRRVLDYCQGRAKSMVVTLPFDPEPALAELYEAVTPTRRWFLDRGFAEEPAATGAFVFRDHGFGAIERELFRSDAHLRPPLNLDDFQVLGGPRGEGVGLLIAREVRAEIDAGRRPDEILILVPRLDEDAKLIRETLQSWSLPVAPARGRRLALVAAVSALRLAARLPAEGWEVADLVRLLRNGQIRWDGPPFERFEAASAIRSTRVFRDRAIVRSALVRAIDGEAKKDVRNERAGRAALDRLAALIDPLALPGRWRVQVDRLRSLADGLNLDRPELEPLWDALEDQGWVLDRLGPAISEASWTWAEFAAEVEAVVADDEGPGPEPAPGTIQIEAVGAADGARAAVVILANLAEGTFPIPSAVDLDPVSPPTRATDTAEDTEDDQPGRPNLAYSREMLRFARVVGSADARLILAYPMSDRNGETLLPAGFLDDLLRRLAPATAATAVELHSRFDPVLADHPELAQSPVDARVLAVALACSGKGSERLRDLAHSPRHAPALLGLAEAFEVAHRRREGRGFGPYDGLVRDPAAVVQIGQSFGPNHPFSASQLESFALCPFQFFQRYVLKLKPVDDLDELAEDYAGRGRDVHQALENLHQQLAAEAESDLAARLPILIETTMRAELEQFEEGEADVAKVLREIETLRNDRSLRRYLAQYRAYADRPRETAVPYRFETKFGQPDKPDSLTHLTIGTDAAAVRLQGVVDRIDLVHQDGETTFRVIDYKTGSHPPGGDVKSGLASQLPLYVMAVEQIILAEGEHAFADTGYWSLPGDGFKVVRLPEWPGYRDRLRDFILALVAELRSGTFPIFSQKKDCPKFCDYHSVCRHKDVRSAGKTWDGRPIMEVET